MTRKITIAMANIAHGLQRCLFLGNLDALRDWGHAKDYVYMQWLMLQQEAPTDFVIATGLQYSVRQFVEWSAMNAGVSLEFKGSGIDEIGVVTAVHGQAAENLSAGDVVVRVDPKYFRPAEVQTLLGDPSFAKSRLGWKPEISVEAMCAEMTAHDMKLSEQRLRSRGR